VVAADINRPNGLAFSPDENKLYIVEYGALPCSLRVYELLADAGEGSTVPALVRRGCTPEDLHRLVRRGLVSESSGLLRVAWGTSQGNAGDRSREPPNGARNVSFGQQRT
jgi:gluconolactonase